MGRNLSLHEIEERIIALSDAMEDGTRIYQERRSAAANAEVEYKLAMWTERLARPVIRGVRTVDEQEAEANIAVEGLYRDHKAADALLDAAKDAQITLRARLDAERTLAANYRSAGG